MSCRRAPSHWRRLASHRPPSRRSCRIISTASVAAAGMPANAWFDALFDLGGSSMVAWLRGLLPVIAALTLGGTAMAADAENTLYMDVPFGRVVIEMRPDLAPNHCAQIKALARRGFYDGVVFHRVIDGFMAQTGDPTGTGSGGSGHRLKAEFSEEPHVRGTLSMARTSDPNSADSQFFICFA